VEQALPRFVSTTDGCLIYEFARDRPYASRLRLHGFKRIELFNDPIGHLLWRCIHL
jgi:hypothetical protein